MKLIMLQVPQVEKLDSLRCGINALNESITGQPLRKQTQLYKRCRASFQGMAVAGAESNRQV